ncbi:unnamed protein product [Caenorhabditis auriculariae]|uniref:Uncharacterized protein n=1 Tax=Caenorhabditis auriculariae TaxID=2777116 RepID=A0A8S1H4I4_9PELO|nr:unnamed protein product [Caenorhabditis auriculariae]
MSPHGVKKDGPSLDVSGLFQIFWGYLLWPADNWYHSGGADFELCSVVPSVQSPAVFGLFPDSAHCRRPKGFQDNIPKRANNISSYRRDDHPIATRGFDPATTTTRPGDRQRTRRPPLATTIHLLFNILCL